MKAVTYSEYAPDDNYAKILKVQDIDDPKPKADEVVFKVKSAALNYNDIWGMRGQPVPVPLPHVSGSDAAGDVIAVGEDVKNIKESTPNELIERGLIKKIFGGVGTTIPSTTQ